MSIVNIVVDIVMETALGLFLAATDSADVLAFALVALAILSAFIGTANLLTLSRHRPSTFPPTARPAMRKRYWALLGVAILHLLASPTLVLWASNLPSGIDNHEWLRAGMLTVILVFLLGTNYAGASLTHILARLKLQRDDPPRRMHGPVALIRTIRENLVAGVVLLGISVLIWYLIDKQLSETRQAMVPVEISLGDTLRHDWTITETPTSLPVAFQGPKEKIQSLSTNRLRAAATISAVTVAEGATQSRIPLPALEYESAGEPIPAEVSASLGASGPIFVTVTKNIRERLEIAAEAVKDRLTDKPPGWEPIVRGTTPGAVWVVYPTSETDGRLQLEFEARSLRQFWEVNKRDRTFTLDLPILLNRDHLRIYRDESLREPITSIQVEIGFALQERTQATFENVGVRVNVPSSFVARKVSIEELPVHPEQSPDRRTQFDKIVVSGPTDRIRQLRAEDLRVTIWINESAVDWAALETGESHGIAGNRYVLTDRFGRPLSDEFELQSPDPRTMFALQLKSRPN